MQDIVKGQSTRRLAIEEEHQIKVSEIVNNKIIQEKFPNLKREVPIKVQESSKHRTECTIK